MQQPTLATLLAISTGALGLFVGATFLGKDTPRRTDVPTSGSVDLTPLIVSMNALRESIDADLSERRSDLAQPAPRASIPESTPSTTSGDPALTQALEELRLAILSMNLQVAGERGPRAGIMQADRLTEARRPIDLDAVESFLERYPEVLKGQIPVELTFYGLADYIELFGTPSEHTASGDGTHYLWYRLDPGQPRDGRCFEVSCTRDATNYIGYVE